MLTEIINKSKKVLKFYKNCRACGSKKVKKVIKLSPTPFEDHFVTKKELSFKQKKYPLELYLCTSCNYLYLSHILNPNFSYKYYLYNSEITLGLDNYFKKNANFIIKKFNLTKKDLVLDIGSNDGTFLKYFKKKKIKVLGIEPALNVSKKANIKKIKTINSFFSDNLTKDLLNKSIKPKIISANYVFANIENINSFINNIFKLLGDDGILAINTGYHPEQFKLNMFDYIYHEHFSYFSLSFLNEFFKNKNLEIFYAKKTKPKLGSMFLLIKKKENKKYSVNSSVQRFLNEEKKNKVNSVLYFKKMMIRINKIKDNLYTLLDKYKNKKIKLLGYGASHSTTILIHQFKLNKFLNYIVDDNPIKQGLYSPNFHIPILKSHNIYKEKNCYVIILAWQHQDKIIKKNYKFISRSGKFIVPLPKIKIIDKIK